VKKGNLWGFIFDVQHVPDCLPVQQLYQQLSFYCCGICVLIRSTRYAGLIVPRDELVHLLFLSFTGIALPSCLQLDMDLLTSSVSCSHFTKDYFVSVDHELLAPGMRACHLPMEKGSYM